MTKLQLAPVTDPIAELRAGRMIVLVDDENRENEGDFVVETSPDDQQSATSSGP